MPRRPQNVSPKRYPCRGDQLIASPTSPKYFADASNIFCRRVQGFRRRVHRSLANIAQSRSPGSRRELKKKKKDAEGVRQYRAANQEIKKGRKKAKMHLIEEQCQDIEDIMKKNSSKKAHQLVKDLTSTKQGRTTTIQENV